MRGRVRRYDGRRAGLPARRLAGVPLALAGVLALTGCTGSSLQSGGDTGFVTGDGGVTVVDAADREPPAAQVSGETVDGEPVDLSDLRGKVVVMPIWGAWCGPCRAEAPALADAARRLADEGVVFLGINSRDPVRDNATNFERGFDLPYDSIYDPDGVTLLAFRGVVTPTSVPSFVVIDQQGRVAGRILGEATTTTVYGVVEDVLGKQLDPTGGTAGDGTAERRAQARTGAGRASS